MAGRGPRSALERAEIGNSRPTVVRSCALLDLTDRHSRSRPNSRHDSGEISALRPLPGAQETGAVGLAGPALMREVLAVAAGVVAGTVVVAALAAAGAVAGAGAVRALAGLGAFVAVVSAAFGEDGDNHASPRGSEE
jgi:hypothetical protein